MPVINLENVAGRRKAEPTRRSISLGGKSLLDIEKLFKTIGFKRNPTALKGIMIGTMMIYGNETEAEFWRLRRLDTEGRRLLDHKDQLILEENSLIRVCPSDGREVFLSKS